MQNMCLDFHFGNGSPTVITNKRSDSVTEPYVVMELREDNKIYPGFNFYMSPVQWIEFKNQVLAADRKMFPGR